MVSKKHKKHHEVQYNMGCVQKNSCAKNYIQYYLALLKNSKKILHHQNTI